MFEPCTESLTVVTSNCKACGFMMQAYLEPTTPVVFSFVQHQEENKDKKEYSAGFCCKQCGHVWSIVVYK